ncbi:MAG TPA: M12 family metallo-peptidase [Woeseiaceae bacterium]|nr:M12 family metallo-peptidase [Woeseiaceae bacterium]
MNLRNRLLVLVCLGLTSPAFGAAVEGITLSHFEPLGRLEIDGLGSGQQKAGLAGPVALRFDALGRTFELQLEPNANLMAAMDGGQGFGDAIPYRGRLPGVQGSWAAVTIRNGMPVGLVFDGEALFALEVPGDALVDTNSPIAYRLADVTVAPGAMSCATGAAAASGSAMFKAVVSGLDAGIAQAPGAVSEITIGAIGDGPFTSDKGATAAADIVARLNIVDVIFSEQLGVQVRVPVIDIFDSTDDPFTSTGDPGQLLDEVRNYRFDTASQRSQGLTHLYTGRNLDGTTVGIAYQRALCNSRFGAGLSEGRGSPNFDALVAAHEIGHNFGAPHDGEAGSPCESQTGDWLMSPRVNGSDQFSACSIQQMQDDIAAAACITALPSTDISLAFRGSTATALFGGTDNVVVDVVNNGTEPSVNVAVDISLPNNVTLNSATSSAGACQSGAGSVSCQLGNVAGTAATEIDLEITGSVVGSGTFSATVTANVDDQAGNNQDALQLTVEPAVNLAINTPPSSQVTLNGSTTLTVTLDNRASLDATGVTLGIALNAGLRANSASWSIGSCTVAAQQVDCQAGQFDRQSSASLTLNVTGVAEGSKNYTVALASAEPDTDASDNNVQGSVSVRTAGGGGGGDDEGGGSAGWLLLTLLAGLSTRRAPQVRRRAG